MEPRIQYAQTADGVSIAFFTLGDGTPLLEMSDPAASHVQLAYQQWPAWYERLAQKRTVVTYDHRGTGLSDRLVEDYSLDAHVGDVETVVNHLGLERFAVWAWPRAGTVAIAYAVRHPERVSRLVLWHTPARASDFDLPQVEALRALRKVDWETWIETIAHTIVGWSAAEAAGRYAAVLREAFSKEDFGRHWSVIQQFDVESLLPKVSVPTLVLHRRQLPWLRAEVSRRIASRIPNARLVLLEGDSAIPWVGDSEAVFKAIDEFLGEGEELAAEAEAPEAGAFRTVLFTDVEGSTSLTQRLGDTRAREVLRTHERIVRDALRSHQGSEVKTMGDGFMASFSSATRALECAISMQRAFAEHNEAAEEPISVRVGLNAGEPIAEEEDLFGAAVIRAARIAALAEGGEILVANVVRELAEGKGFLFSDRGPVALRGFDDPVKLFELRWQEEG